jgi:hypothetical protein
MAAAIAVKFSALWLGLFPVTMAGVAVYFVERKKVSKELLAQESRRIRLNTGLALAGLLFGLILLFFVHVLPNWEKFLSMVLAVPENYGFDWKQKLTIPGRVMVSKEVMGDTFWPVIWRVAIWSPVIIASVWFYFLWLMLQLRTGIKNTLQSLSVLGTGTLVWVIGTLLAICSSPSQPDYRYLPMIPGFAILGSLFFTRIPTLINRTTSLPPIRRIFSFFLWAVLLFPLMLVLKPWTARLIMLLGKDVSLGDRPGIEFGVAATLFAPAWFLLLLILANFRRRCEQVSVFLLGRVSVIMLPVLVLFECWVVGSYFYHTESTLIDRQAELANYVKEGEMVAGLTSGTVFLPIRVQTVRRASFATPELTLDHNVWDELRPNYFLIIKRINFSHYESYQMILENLAQKGYEALFSFELGPKRSGKYRFEFELLRRTVNGPG